ncbi:RNA-directed DNA polymerase [Luteimonas deserti]|uniref:RNA-directed DNA polymerase n=1 Tax=Luteimonas deserti TaxID=2752306 RepID=A0A7Z0QQY8_9GAMM|nr:RNA-directed DNA polymerase [Luteimonas deserti]NYZ63174.1 RNA-directed DNA polymerase [Luteimonas deserti]
MKIKDSKSVPRRISIPSIRDRIVLSQLNKIIRIAFPRESRSPLAGPYVRKIVSDLATVSLNETWTAGCDIKKFYDSINRVRLKKIIDSRLGGTPAAGLIDRAIQTPTVPLTYRSADKKKYLDASGVAQGLAISNALASIYLAEVDEAMQAMPVKYYRFVDDVLIVGSKEDAAKAQRSFAARVRARSLSVHKLGDKKSHHLPLVSSFSYLGYIFQLPSITVRSSTIERLLHSIAAKLSDYRHNSSRVLERRPYLTRESYRDVFMAELNERISGAISGDRKYGWVAYFSEINDLSALHRIDHAVKGMVSVAFGDMFPELKLKRFSRAYFEMRHRPYGGYVRNYDLIITPAEMIRFLSFRGRVGPGEKLSEEEIIRRYEAYRDNQIGQMLADEETIY